MGHLRLNIDMSLGDFLTDAKNRSAAVQAYGYGLNDIQSARDDLNRSETMGQYNMGQKFDQAWRKLHASFNRRGMINSGIRNQAAGRLGANQLMEQTAQALALSDKRAGLDRKRLALEEAFSAYQGDDAIADALRRLAVSQSLQGLI